MRLDLGLLVMHAGGTASGSGVRLPVVERGNNDYPEAVKEALCVHEIFRRLGFSSDEIFVTFDHLPVFKVILKTKQDGRRGVRSKQFVVDAGAWKPGEKDNVKAIWKRAAYDWNKNAGRDTSGWMEIYRMSAAKRALPQLLFVMLDRGFELPTDVSNL